MAPPANNVIMSGTSTRSFRHLEHQNPSIISGDIGRARRVQQFQMIRGVRLKENSWLRGCDVLPILDVYVNLSYFLYHSGTKIYYPNHKKAS